MQGERNRPEEAGALLETRCSCCAQLIYNIAQLDDVYTGIMIHARLQSKVPVNFSFVDVTGRSVTEADATCHYIAHGHGLISGCAVRSNYICLTS